MRIQFLIDGFIPSENAEANMRWLLELAIREVGCPTGAVTDLIVADKAHFGEGIHRLCPGLPYTDNENYAAVAKTVGLELAGGMRTSGIVLRDFIANQALAALAKEWKDRSGEEQRFIYTVWHETAHALDATRQTAERSAPESPVAPGQLFKVRYIAEFFTEVVLSEIAACRLAAFACSQTVLDMEMDSDRETIARMLAGLRQHTAAHRGDPDELWRIAFEAAQTFWVPFTQYGKTIAHIAGNPELRSAIILWKDCPPEVEDIFKDYVALLNETFGVYPAAPPDFSERLTALWVRMAAAYGVTFPESPDSGDAIYWRWRPVVPAGGDAPRDSI